MAVKTKKNNKIKYIFLILITIGVIINISQHKNDILKKAYPIKYSDNVYKYSKQYDVDPLLVFSIIRVESNFNASACSKKGAKGLMQITDSTGRWIANKVNADNFEPELLFNPEYNIMFGCWYLRNLINQFDGDVKLALLAYNGGSGNVEKWLKNKDYNPTGERLDVIPFGETQRYIKKIEKDYSVYKSLYQPQTK